ncbi:protein activity of BC1 complex kinase 7, chloroplastic [Tanacetum coccineum]
MDQGSFRNLELTAPWTGIQIKVPVIYVVGEKDPVYTTPGAKTYIQSEGYTCRHDAVNQGENRGNNATRSSSSSSDSIGTEQFDRYSWNHMVQDRVPAFSPEKAKGFIEKELGAPVNIIFKEFEERPIAAASLGQVHRSIVHNGEKVVVKVQRPGLKKLFDIDLRCGSVIHSFHPVVAEYFQRSETLGGPTRDWMGIYDECAK